MRGNSDPTAALLLGVAAGLWTFFKGFRVMREYKVIEDTPRIPIRSVPMGFVHIRGQAQSEKVLSSPISRTSCCFYRVEIDQWKSSGKSHSWQNVCIDVDGFRFYVADSTGKVLIDAHAAEYDLPLVATRVVDSAQNAATASAGVATDSDLLRYVHYAQTHSLTERVGQFIDKRFEKAGAADNPQLQAKQQAVRDLFAAVPEVLKGGTPPVGLLAKLANASGPLPDAGKEQRRQIFLQHLQLMESMAQSGQLPFRVPVEGTATGRFRLREYLIVPGQEYLVDGTCVENSSAPAGDHAMIAKGHNEPTFLISAKTDTEIRHGLRKRAGFMILGGAGLALACLAGLLVHFHLF
jgi:hypothetical protein